MEKAKDQKNGWKEVHGGVEGGRRDDKFVHLSQIRLFNIFFNEK